MTQQQSLTHEQLGEWWDAIREGHQRLQDLWLRDGWTPHRTAIQFGELCHDYMAHARELVEKNDIVIPFHEWVLGRHYVGGEHRQDLAVFADQSIWSINIQYGYEVTLAGSARDGLTIATCEPPDEEC